MAAIFVYADDINICAEMISKAKQLGKEAYAISLDAFKADHLTNLGADKVYLLKGNDPWPENYIAAMAELIRNETAYALLIGATVRGRNIAAQIAAYLNCNLVSDATDVRIEDGIIIADRMMYGGSVVKTEVLSSFGVITIAGGKYEVLHDENKCAEIIEINVDVSPTGRVKLLETSPVVRQGNDIAKAQKIVAVGMGFDKKDDLHLAEELAAALGADLGCTRGVAEERQWMPVETYIGISGAAVRPELYISLAVSGQIQHVIGIRDSKIIVAIDKNEKAPIFKAADYGIVGDVYEIAPLLSKAINNIKNHS